MDENDEAGDDERFFFFENGELFLELKNFPQKDHGVSSQRGVLSRQFLSVAATIAH